MSELVLKKPFHLEDLSATIQQLFCELEDKTRPLDSPGNLPRSVS